MIVVLLAVALLVLVVRCCLTSRSLDEAMTWLLPEAADDLMDLAVAAGVTPVDEPVPYRLTDPDFAAWEKELTS